MRLASSLVLALSVVTPSPAAPAPRPNIVLIVADDMGFSDIGCYGSEIPTPSLDRLAAEGVRFSQFYNAARCCPTRASLLTGLYPHQTGIGNMVVDQGLPAYSGDLNSQCVTLAEALGGGGYRCYMAGKWHLTKHTDMFAEWIPPERREYVSRHNWPLQRGFHRFFGTINGAGSFFDPATLVEGNEAVAAPPPGFYYTDAITDWTVSALEEHASASPDSPFFFYVAHTAPHWPLHARAADIERHRGRYAAGWDRIRQERHRRLLALGVLPADTALTERSPEVPAWEDEPDKAYYERAMEIYAAQVEAMDRGIGRILDALERTGRRKNTLVVFLSDNGGCAEIITDRWPRSLHMPLATRDGRPVRRGPAAGDTLGSDTSYASYGVGWANASNTPFRQFKHYIHEGGISTPLVVAWPSGIAPAVRGTVTPQVGHIKDLMPTFLELAGVGYPETFRGHALTPLEGRSLAPVFRGATVDTGPLFWEHHGNRGVRDGRWKLVAEAKGAWELYDLSTDRGEQRNLASAQPERVRELVAAYAAWAQRVGVVENPPRPRRRDSGG